jgi:hypothetical protein
MTIDIVNIRTRGGVSNTACRSRICLFDPLTRNAPWTSVAARIPNSGTDIDMEARYRTILLQI